MRPETSRQLRRAQYRTTSFAMITVVVVLAVSGLGLVRFFHHQQLRQVDAALQAAGRVGQQSASADPSGSRAIADAALVQVIDDTGAVVYASTRLSGMAALRSVDETSVLGQPVTVEVDGLGPLRVLGVRLDARWLLLAASLDEVHAAETTLETALLVSLPLVAVALALVLWRVVGTTMRPVREAIEREQRLLTDASHELRTPLAGARALLESESLDPDEIELNRIEALGTLDRLEAIVSGLLLDARTSSPAPMSDAALVDLDELVLEIVRHTPAPTGLVVDTSRVSGGQVRGRPDDLERMISNLVSNAVRHADRRVRVSVIEHSGTVLLMVADDGSGIPPDRHQLVFERFTRLDDARSRDRGGVGLGLAIVRSVVTAHGGSISIATADIGGAEFTVRLPASVPGGDSGRSDHMPAGGGR